MKRNFTTLICLIATIFAICPSTIYAYSKRGSKSYEVMLIQQALNNKGYECGLEDGIYGAKTTDAVKAFQLDNQLTADGICGAKTLSALKVSHQADVELLAKVINGEARGESFEGQVAVGAVVLNRVKHPSFPDNIHDVVYQNGAFTAVNDGQIKKNVTQSSKKAALAALEGNDPSGGAIYYYNPKTATCKWIKSRTPIKKIGNHLFCK